MRLPAFTPRSNWTAPRLADLPSWGEAQRVAVDIETRDPQLTTLGPGVRRDGYIVGVSFSIEDGPCAYLPTRHEGGGNLDEAQVFAYLADQAKVFKGDLITANGQYDLDYLAERHLTFRQVRFHRDVQVAEPLCDELQYTYNLEAITARRGLPGKDERMLRAAAGALGIDPKKDLWRLHAKHVGAYAEQDARALHALIRKQERQLEDEGLWSIYDLECRLLPVLLKMRRRGVRVDFDQLERIEQWSVKEEQAALDELHRLSGRRLDLGDVNKKEALLPIVQQIGVTIPRTAPSANFPDGQPSLTRQFLDGLHGPIGGLINRARRFNKLRGTFVEGRRRHAVNGRIHCTFNQLRSEKPGQEDEDGGARYGRLSCSDPNLQQEPARDEEIGPEWRKVYVPDEGGQWACLDFSQQEPRWAVHWAERFEDADEKAARSFAPTGARLAGDRYRSDPKADNHDMMTKLIHGEAAWDGWDKDTRKLHRSRAKNIFLGLCYGMGGAKLCHDLGLPTKWIPSKRLGREIEVAGEEGQALLDQFDRALPWIRGTAKRCEKFATKHGYVRTVLGRKCRFPQRMSPSGKPMTDRFGRPIYDWAHKAFNRVIQGSSGDQTKAAMVEADAAGIRLQLQVHDELDLTIWSPEEGRQLAQIMREVVPCSVPHRVDVEAGPNWAEIKELEAR
jgi:DNA polymerase I-like protein with 3'-5' exonuclease and polymerase domains